MNKLRLMLSVITLNQSSSVLMRTLKDESVPMVLRKTAWRLLNERYQRIKLNQAYRIENFLLVADFEYALEEHDELAE